MYLTKSIPDLIKLFTEAISTVSNAENNLGFNVCIKGTITQITSNTFFKVADLEYPDSSIQVRMNKNSKFLNSGDTCLIHGYMYVYVNKTSNNNMLINVLAESVVLINPPAIAQENIMEVIKKLPLPQKAFPSKYKLRLAIICPKNIDSKSIVDFRSKIEASPVKDAFELREVNCSIENISEVVKAIETIDIEQTDIFILLRGGGDYESIQLLDNPQIATAISALNCYKMIGVGHASDRLAIEMLFNDVSQTPTDIANTLVNEVSKRRNRQNNNKQAITTNPTTPTLAMLINELGVKIQVIQQNVSKLTNVAHTQQISPNLLSHDQKHIKECIDNAMSNSFKTLNEVNSVVKDIKFTVNNVNYLNQSDHNNNIKLITGLKKLAISGWVAAFILLIFWLK